MKRFRAEVHGHRDTYLIAKFFRASSSQDAMEKCKEWLGGDFGTCRVTITLDE